MLWNNRQHKKKKKKKRKAKALHSKATESQNPGTSPTGVGTVQGKKKFAKKTTAPQGEDHEIVIENKHFVMCFKTFGGQP